MIMPIQGGLNGGIYAAAAPSKTLPVPLGDADVPSTLPIEQLDRSLTERLKLGPGAPRVISLLGLCIAFYSFAPNAQAQYSVSDALHIITQSDGGYCDQQKGSYYPYLYSAGCCGSPGFRACARLLHPGKGSWGISAGCTDPSSNQVHGSTCELNGSPAPIPSDFFNPYVPTLGTNISFLVTSDLHFWRTTFNVSDQVSHPAAIASWAAVDQTQYGGAYSPYGAVLIPGDMSTGSRDTDYHHQDYRISAYRMLWENNWPNTQGFLPGASIGLPVLPTLGNHDSNDGTWWNYMEALTQNLHADRNHTGCLIGVSPGCVDEGASGGSLNYSITWEGVHFLMLNTQPGEHTVNYQTAQGSDGMTWLKNDLAYYVGSTGMPVVVVQHYGLDSELVGGSEEHCSDGSTRWWCQNEVNAFQQALANYNVIGWFSGHTHQLGSNALGSAINQTTGNTAGLGETLDNFNDGSGGDCKAHGNGVTNTPGGDPDNSTYCSDGLKSFLAVQIKDRIMRVRTFSYSATASAPSLDNSIQLAGRSPADTASCNKWTGSYYKEYAGGATISADNATSKITVTNTSTTAAIHGPLALWIEGPSTINSWDFVDSCVAQTAHKFLSLSQGPIPAGQSVSVTFSGHISGLSNVHLIQLAPEFTVSPVTPFVDIVGAVGTDGASAAPTTLQVDSVTGAPIAFTLSVDADGSFTSPWLQVTPVSPLTAGPIYTTPQTFSLIAKSLTTYPELFQSITVTDVTGLAAPLTIRPILASSTLKMTSNATGAQIMLNGHPETLPTSYTGIPGGSGGHTSEQVAVAVTAPIQYPSPGTKLRFNGWTDHGAASHSYSLARGGITENLGANFETDYLVTPTVSSGGRLNISPNVSDGYYVNGTQVSYKAVPQTNYYFVGYTGDILSTQAQVEETVNGPVSFTATFAPQPVITYSSNVPSSEALAITLNGDAHTMPFAPHEIPGTSISMSVPASVVSRSNRNIRYLFQNWSDGLTTPSRTIAVPAANNTYTANYITQVFVTVTANPSDGGTVTGGGWFTTQSCQNADVQASPAANYYFAGFSGGVTGTQNPLHLTCISQPVVVTANFSPDPRTIITSTPSNAVILVDNLPYSTPHTFFWTPGTTHKVDATNPKPPTGTRFSFSGWSDGGAGAHQITAGSSNATLTASYTVSYLVSVTISGPGTVNLTPPSPTSDGYYPASKKLTVTAVPNSGYSFASFGGDLSGFTNPQSISVQHALNITASFVNPARSTP